ncbi:polysaccharide deacetylase family protein [Plantactinospora endophytica]|uniref:Oligosaccharide deacetylase n=1 Tax=Plantactinospora endophytica TaxID=673535 RepID=A0ABQ4DX25_9ACTN|nr:polysaccharide deacetylase family protein [Plantactinospora endophytica]GIG87005.1 oligosaccharide deacetylase [Plantactinospora endophytica]
MNAEPGAGRISWPYLSAQALHYLLFALRAQQFATRRPMLGDGNRPVFGVPGHSVALTIDDGPHPEWTPRMLDLLDRHSVRATFFLIGARVAEHPGLARRIHDAGHLVGNHSMSHPQPFAALPPDRLHAEIGQAQRRIEDAVGFSPRLFRAPGGNWSPTVLRATADLGLVPVDWTVNPSDWRSPGVHRIVRRLSRSRPGHVLLCHDGGGDRSQTVAALETVLPRLLDRGLRFVVPAAER